MKAIRRFRAAAIRCEGLLRSARWRGCGALVAALSAALCGFAPSALAQPSDQAKPYHYVSLYAALSPTFDFLDVPVKVTESRAVYITGYVCGENTCDPKVAVYREGAFEVLGDGLVYAANEQGTAAGSVLIDPENGIEQAAIFAGGSVELIPRLPGETTSYVSQLTDSGIALVTSDAPGSTLYLYVVKRHRVVPLDLGTDRVLDTGVNDFGNIGGTSVIPSLGNRGFRYDTSSGTKTLLEPTPTEPDSYGLSIDDRGRVLGYSFVPGGIERIGWWNRQGTFREVFVEGSPEVPTISNALLWNDSSLIVITKTLPPDLNSYLVPAPGVRLKLADLADQLPVWTLVTDVNNRGDLVGVGGNSYFSGSDVFLLERSTRKAEIADSAAPDAAPSEAEVARRLDAASKVERQRRAAARPYGPGLQEETSRGSRR